MKNIKLIVATVFVFFAFGMNPVNAEGKNKTPVSATMTPAELQVLIDRLEEIKEMDRSLMTKDEKKELREEIRNTKEEIKRNNSGVYLSVGALLLIIILLIVLL
jgi:hypothetical protein